MNEHSSAHIPHMSKASLQCEYECDFSNEKLSWLSKDNVGTGVTCLNMVESHRTIYL